ncbi:MAG TPA: glycosyltransferase [Bacteroidales bacterium]|nr:glycosyltransferase [Bacteroidales bacterium]
MKKVLILAYDFPPYVSVGSLRPYSWFQYFHEFGVYPIIITRQWSNEHRNFLDYIAQSESDEVEVGEYIHGTIIRTPYSQNISNRMLEKYGKKKYSYIRKIFTAYYEIMQYHFNIGPKIEIYKAAHEYLKNNNVDCILTSGEPFILFRYAHLLSKEFKIPWIADYRDPWTQDKKRSYDKISKFLNKFWEKRYVSTASIITTVTPFFREKIKTLFPAKRFEIIPNGYNPKSLSKISTISQKSDILRISFIGTIYKWHPIESVLRVFQTFIQSIENPRIELRFYGINNAEEYKHLILVRYNFLAKYVSIIPKIQNEQLMEYLAQDNAFLLFNYYSYTGTKIYDYLALKRKILLCYTDDPEGNILKEKYYNIQEENIDFQQVQSEIIKQTNSGILVKDSTELLDVFSELYSEFIQNGFISCNSINTEQYSRKIQASNICSLIKDIC